MHGGQPSGSSAPNEAQQEGFRLVVPGVSHRHHVGRVLAGSALEEGMASDVRRIFNRPVLGGGERRDINLLDYKRDAEGGRDACAKLRVGVGRLAQAVVQVGHGHQVELAVALERTQDVQERHRVGSARQRGHDTRATACELVPLERPPNTFD